MTTERAFLIERYCTGNWPQVRGDLPFFATGPSFDRWAIPGSLEKFGEHRFLDNLARDFEEAFGYMGQSRVMAAWALLEEGIVQALWVDHSPVPSSERWTLAVDQLAVEIPHCGALGEDLLEYLSGLAGPGHFRSYVGEDGIVLCPLLP